VQFVPPADGFKTDRWGQKVAVFHLENLKPGDVAQARYTVDARMGSLRFYVHPERVGRLDQIPGDIRDTYLSEGSRYFLSEPIIKETAKKIIGNETNPYWMARRLFEYEIEKVDYELAGAWDIAPTILKRGTGSCSEYSFLYIALCRAAGLPARYQAGVSYRGDDACVDNVYHRWVEVYLPNYGWIPVDPSRGDQPWPAGRAASFGMVGNGVFITTHGGGDSEYMGWTYNSNSRYSFTGKCDVVQDSYAIWRPLGATGKETPADTSVCKPSDGKICK
jgi:transglutaminase-like putative cysteine protease